MIFRRLVIPATLVLCAGFATGPALAQQLPAPAPQPSATQSATPVAVATPAPSPAVANPNPAVIPSGTLGGPSQTPSMAPQAVPSAGQPQSGQPLIEAAPPSQESPIIIGEPIRREDGTYGTYGNSGYDITIPGVARVAGIMVEGLTDDQAQARLEAGLAGQLKGPIRLIVGQYQYTYQRSELGATIPYLALIHEARQGHGNVPIRFELDPKLTYAALSELDGEVREDFTRTGLNIPGSYVRVKVALGFTPIRDAALMMTTVINEVPTPDEIAALQAPQATTGAPSPEFPYLLSEFATHYIASLKGRTVNLKIAARNINGNIVQPGDIFSANRAIGPRDADAGWKEAMMFVSGKVVSGTGSGICQCASTLYNAALLADLPIVERHAHSMRVTYVPPSRDAALLWGSKDFKFRNSTDAALYVQTFVAGSKFHVRMWTSKPVAHPPVQVVSQVVSSDASGLHSVAYKIVGNEKERISRDFYMPHP